MVKDMKQKIFFGFLLLVLLLLSFAGCGNNQKGGNPSAEVVIASKNTQEQQILANLAAILIEEKTEHKVTIKAVDNITSESLYQELKDKKIDLYFDYAGTIYENALKLPKADMPYATVLVELQKNMIENGIYVSNSLGYDGGTTLFMTPETREKLGGITNISELKKAAKDLRIGMEPWFYNQNDCYKALCKLYGLKFKESVTYDEDSGFYALRRGDIDIMIGSRTSIYNNMFNLFLMKDDKRFFTPQTACYLADDQLLIDYPEIKDTLNIMEDMLTSGKISIIKRRVYLDNNDMDTYLHDFLRARNLL